MARAVRVDAGDVADAARAVHRVAEDLGSAPTTVRDGVESSRLASALATFDDRWMPLLVQVEADSREFATRLDASARAYSDTDEHLALAAQRVLDEFDEGLL